MQIVLRVVRRRQAHAQEDGRDTRGAEGGEGDSAQREGLHKARHGRVPLEDIPGNRQDGHQLRQRAPGTRPQ